jgi:hypothetical protein
MSKITRPSIIDIEASGFGGMSYPIEIGAVLDDGQKYCTLILPAPDWNHWDEDAEKVHRVSRDILETYGKSIDEVTEQLNDLLAGKTLYTDGWVVDRPWLTTLFHAAGKPMLFGVSPLEMILSEEQMRIWHQTRDKVIRELQLARHRASYDAWIIQETFTQTLDVTGS